MNLPHVPNSVICDSGHAEITIISLILLLAVFIRLWWVNRQERHNEAKEWRLRMEGKLDQALEDHQKCRQQLPFQYVTKEEFKDLMAERNKQWDEFNRRFEDFISKFWNHGHDNAGKVERMQ